MRISIVLAVAALLAGCAGGEPTPPPEPVAPPAEKPAEPASKGMPGPLLGSYTDDTAEFPKVIYEDGGVTLNDRCPVRKAKLNRKMSPVFVNGRPVGFC